MTEVVLIGDKKIYEQMIGAEQTTGFVRVSTRKGTPVIFVEGLGREIWLVDIKARLDVYLGGLTPTKEVLELL